jgi:uncharacterized protein YerC
MTMNEIVSIEENNRRLLFRTLAALESEDEAAAFIMELCYPQEIKNMAQRVAIAELRVQNFTYQDIIKQLMRGLSTVSTATVNRVSDTVKNGPGYLRKIIQRTSGVEGC